MQIRRDQHHLTEEPEQYAAYAISYMAQDPQAGETIVAATYVFAYSDEEAKAFALDTALEELPPEEGYINHIGAAHRIPDVQLRHLVASWPPDLTTSQPVTRTQAPRPPVTRTQAPRPPVTRTQAPRPPVTQTRPQTAPQPLRPPTRQRYPMEARSCTLDDVPQCRRCRRAAVEFDPRRGWLCEVHRG